MGSHFSVSPSHKVNHHSPKNLLFLGKTNKLNKWIPNSSSVYGEPIGADKISDLSFSSSDTEEENAQEASVSSPIRAS